MEPISASIGAIVTYLTGKLKSNQSINDFFNDFTEATVNWIRPIFIKDDGTVKTVLSDLQKNPDSKEAQIVVKGLLKSESENKSDIEIAIREMHEMIKSKQFDEKSQNISSIKQENKYGDNIGRDKNVY